MRGGAEREIIMNFGETGEGVQGETKDDNGENRGKEDNKRRVREMERKRVK